MHVVIHEGSRDVLYACFNFHIVFYGRKLHACVFVEVSVAYYFFHFQIMLMRSEVMLRFYCNNKEIYINC